jgi:hypothetical protein
MTEPSQVDLSCHASPDAALPSTVSGRPGDIQTIETPQDTDSHGVLSDTGGWPPETDRLMTLVVESSTFLTGPGVFPVQGAMSLPQAMGQEQEKETPRPDQVTLFEDKRSEAMVQLPSGEPGNYQSHQS